MTADAMSAVDFSYFASVGGSLTMKAKEVRDERKLAVNNACLQIIDLLRKESNRRQTQMLVALDSNELKDCAKYRIESKALSDAMLVVDKYRKQVKKW
jgi:hypothetical protein